MANRNDLGRRVATAEHCLVAHPRTGVTPDQLTVRNSQWMIQAAPPSAAPMPYGTRVVVQA